MDLSDGRTNLEVCSFSVEFIGLNHLPYFSPVLTSYLQIYKQPSPYLWMYEIPAYFDEDVHDELTLTVDLLDTAEFASYSDSNGGIISIEDISSDLVPTGTFSILVTLSDGTESVATDITVKIYDAPVYEDSADEGL